MAHYHFHASVVKRSEGQSVVDRVAYAMRETLYDSYTGKTCYRRRGSEPRPFSQVLLPQNAPAAYQDVQFLLNELNASERRSDAQMARAYDLALPNELPFEQQIEIARFFIEASFLTRGQCAIYAIHRNPPNPVGREALPPISGMIRANPHMHLIVPFRSVDAGGFCPTKLASRDTKRPEYLISLREFWADIQNRYYERAELPERVSAGSNLMQGKHDLPAPYIDLKSIAIERAGVRTPAGDRYRETLERSGLLYREPEHERSLSRELR